MQTLFWFSALLVMGVGLLYTRQNLKISSAILTGFFLLWSYYSGAGIFTQIFVWAGFLLVALTLNLPFIRRPWLTQPVFDAFRKVVPKMSDTEREALEAGNVWWDAQLFSGKPDWSILLNHPQPILSNEEREFIDGPVNTLCNMLDDWSITQHSLDLPQPVWSYLKQLGFFGMIIPKHYGGLEFSAYAHSCVVMKIAGRSITGAVTVMVPNSLGPAELLLRYGTPQQKDYYLPRLARGQEIPCFALTSPEAGSDAASMTDHGIVCRGEFKGEKNVLGIRLNWEKRYITLGPVATVLGLAFKLYDPDHLIGDKDEWGITCALIPTDTKGVEIGRRHFPLNSAFQNGPNKGRDVFIPLDYIIGGQTQAGQGWRMLMECLAAGRSISLPALATGAGKLTARVTGAYARIRRQFKTPIGRFEGVEEALARIAATTYTMDAARSLTASALDQGQSPSVISAIVKYHLTEAMRRCIDDAMDVHGGSGICMGPRNLLARAYQSVPISITVEGANILTRSLIIFGQGAIRCHPYVLKEMSAVNNPDPEAALKDFDQAFWGHVGFTLSNGVRTVALSLTAARFSKQPVADASRRYFQQLTRMSSAFAFTADIAMAVMGGALKRKEKLSSRLGDVLSHLYLASASLKRFQEQGCPAADWPLLQWSCEHSLQVIQQSLDAFLINFPNRYIAWVLRRMIFPFGASFRGPSDDLGHQVSTILLQPSSARDRLTEGMFLPALTLPTPGTLLEPIAEPLARLEYALGCVIAAEPAEKKLRDVISSCNILHFTRDEQLRYAETTEGISAADAALIRAADAARLEVITVDDFSNVELKAELKNASSGKKLDKTSSYIATDRTATLTSREKDPREPGNEKECA